MDTQEVEGEAVFDLLIDLFCIKTLPAGRELIGKLDNQGRSIAGPWNDTQRVDGQTITNAREISPPMIASHLEGTLLHKSHPARLLVYPITHDGKTNLTAIDIDIVGERHKPKDGVYNTFDEAKAAALCVISLGADSGVKGWFEVTRSGGIRVWFFHYEVSAEISRAFGYLMIKRSGMHASTEIFPKQNKCAENGTGNGIFLPFYGKAGEGRQVFIDTETGEYIPVEQFVAMAIDSRTPAEVLEDIVAMARRDKEIPAQIKSKKREDGTGDGYAGDDKLSNEERAGVAFGFMAGKCAWLSDQVEKCESGQQIPYDDWLRVMTILRSFGPWGRKKLHELSAFDDRYDAIETDHKIDSLTGKPMLCATSGCGRNPHDECGMPPSNTSPICFAYAGLRQLPMAEAETAETNTDSGDDVRPADAFDYEKCVAGPPWTNNRSGLWKTKLTKDEEQDIKVLPNPLYVSERVLDIDTEMESVTLVWKRDHKIKRRTVPQKLIASTREILELANDGLLVNSANATNVMQYLSAVQSENIDKIPLTHSVSACGWKRLDNVDVFMWGHKAIVSPGQIAPTITFTSESRESRDLLQGIKSGGMADGWSQIIPIVEHYPVVKFMVLASFLSPFLETLKINQNPVIEVASQTSRGKTTAMMVAASVWGYPVEGAGIIRSWNATPVYIERYGAGTNGLPMFFDESQNAKPDQLQQTIYQVANGTGRGRGTKEGSVQKITRYRSVFFSAGESKIVSTANFDGAQARVASFWGSPFGDDQGAAVRKLQSLVATHYGHAGPTVLKAFLKNPEKTGETMRKIHEAAAERLRESASDDIGARLANLFAGVEAVGMFVNKVLTLGWDIPKVISDAFAMVGTEKIVSMPQRALEDVVSWAHSNESLFIGSDTYNKDFLKAELAGVFHMDGTISFMPDRLKGVLSDRKYDYETTLRNWRDNGWLVIAEGAQKESRKLRQVKINGKRWMCPSLNADAVYLARSHGNKIEGDFEEYDVP